MGKNSGAETVNDQLQTKGGEREKWPDKGIQVYSAYEPIGHQA